MPHEDFDWFVAMTSTAQTRCPDGEDNRAMGSEFMAEHNLRMAGFRTFLPFRRIRRRFKVPSRDETRVEWVRQAYFPRYLFVRICKGQSFAAVNDTIGVATIVHCGDEPLPVPASVIDEMQSRADDRGCMDISDTTRRIKFKRNEQVRFIEGDPYEGFVAAVSVDKGNSVRIWLEMLGREREIPVTPSRLRPVE